MPRMVPAWVHSKEEANLVCLIEGHIHSYNHYDNNPKTIFYHRRPESILVET